MPLNKETGRFRDRQIYRNRKKYKTPITRLDLINHLVKAPYKIIKHKNNLNTYLGAYLDIMMEAVLEGQEVEFPGGLTISIRKKVSLKPVKWTKSFYIKEGQKLCYNPNRPDMTYFFYCRGSLLDENDSRLTMSDKWRRKLNKILRFTDLDYPMYEHTEKS